MIRKTLQVAGLVLLGLLVFINLIWFTVDVSPVKGIKANREFQPVQSYEGRKLDEDSLLSLIGDNKSIPEKYSLSILLALSHFPELREIPIQFRLTADGAPMESSFNILTLLLPKGKRKYVILLLDEEGTFYDPIIMKNLSLDLQIAIMAHELCHTIYYHDLNTLEVIKWGMEYLVSPQFAGIHERNSDLLAIYKGFGWQLYNYAYFVRHVSVLKDYYESEEGKWIDSFYMTDEEILNIMFQLNGYYGNTGSL